MAKVKTHMRAIDPPVILASASPRRKSLLEAMDLVVRTYIHPFNEDISNQIPVYNIAETIARLKWDQIQPQIKKDEIWITADTVVIFNGQALQKPQNRDEAYQMLSQLSGQNHDVTTGVCLGNTEKTIQFTECTKVYFSSIDHQDIQYYIQKYEPYDKAGSYGIQEWLGWTHVEKIEGSFSNVMGLPTEKIYQRLQDFKKT